MLTIENGVLIKCDENATEVVIPADIEEIKTNAFEGCKSLKVLRFPKDFDFEYLYDNLDPYDMRDENELYYGKIDTFLIDYLCCTYTVCFLFWNGSSMRAGPTPRTQFAARQYAGVPCISSRHTC